MSTYQPPFHVTDDIMNYVFAIGEQVGRITVLSHDTVRPQLRKVNRVKTIHSSLAIEQNSLSLEQVTAILDGRRILGNPIEIQEVQNAGQAYELLQTLDPYSVDDLLKAHQLMMNHLIAQSVSFRSDYVGVMRGEQVVHVAPPADLVPQQIRDLLDWCRTSTMHPLITSAIFHYEFEFIHPFADGNGRTGRMWHTLMLGQWKELFYWLPIENLIREQQQEYYQAIEQSTVQVDCSIFVEFMLRVIEETLRKTEVI